jgi:hypothetical protein
MRGRISRSDRKVARHIPGTSRVKELALKSGNKNVTFTVGNLQRFQRYVRSLFSVCLMQPCITETVRQTRFYYCFLSFFASEGSGYVPLNSICKLSKNEVPDSVLQRTFVALMTKTSLHFDCLKPTYGLAREGYNMA